MGFGDIVGTQGVKAVAVSGQAGKKAGAGIAGSLGLSGSAAGIVGDLAGKGVAALASAGIGALMGWLGGSGRTDPDVQFCFFIEIDGLQTVKFTEASGLEWTVETESFNEGGNNLHKVNLIGQGSFKPLVIKKGFYAGNGEFFTWLKTQMDPSIPTVRSNVSVVIMNEAGDEIGRYNLYNAFCTKYQGPTFNAKQSEIGFEEIEISYDWFEFHPGDALTSLFDAAVGMGLSALGGVVKGL
ncbi:MAG: phage tail protein [Myxococcales bacterium]|nr:phage tail protein [Myxococcales bacterium]